MITIALSKPTHHDIASVLIRKITKFDASHASIHLLGKGLFADEPMVMEAGKFGVVIVHGKLWATHNEPVHSYRLVREQEAGRLALNKMWKYLGEGYDFKGIFYFAMRLALQRYLGVKMPTPDTPDSMFCSELAARWLIALGQELDRNLVPEPADAVSPKDVALILDGLDLFEKMPCELSS